MRVDLTMADPSIPRTERRDHYVYVLFRDTGVPFYVGKGCGRMRVINTVNIKQCGDTWKGRIIRDMADRGIKVPLVKIAEHLTEDAAFAVERAFIEAIGKDPAGPLVNHHAGGSGPREGRQPTSATRAKLSAANKGRKHTTEARANMSHAHMGKPGTPHTAERRAKLSAAKTGKKGHSPSEETREKLRIAHTGKKMTPEQIAKGVAKRTGMKRSAESRARMSASAKRRWAKTDH
jgi:hypothetical protein